MAANSPNQSPIEATNLTEDQTHQVPQIRLQLPFSPLPEMRIQIPFQTDSPLSAYTDDEATTPDSPRRYGRIMLKDSNESSPMDQTQSNNMLPPPDYEPMHDYLRALATNPPQRSARYYSPNSNTFLSPTSRPQTPRLYMPYTDSPTADGSENNGRRGIITLSPLSADTPSAPPSYEELYLQHPCPRQQSRLLELVRELEDSESNVAEEVCKFVLGLLFLVLLVLVIGLIFNWGRPMPLRDSLGRPAGPQIPTIHDFSRVASLAQAAKIKTLCGGRCKIAA